MLKENESLKQNNTFVRWNDSDMVVYRQLGILLDFTCPITSCNMRVLQR